MSRRRRCCARPRYRCDCAALARGGPRWLRRHARRQLRPNAPWAPLILAVLAALTLGGPP